MKANKYIILGTLLALVSAVGCKRMDPDKDVINQLDFTRCLTPVSVSMIPTYDKVKVDLKVFPDAEYYDVEVYDSPVSAEDATDESSLVDKFYIYPEELPYTFKTLADVKLYYRISALNETKERSYWSVGSFVTETDPSTVCSIPNVTVADTFNKIKFTWTVLENEKYILEVYSKAIPASGEPSEEDLYAREELLASPFVMEFSKTVATYWFRMKAVDVLGERTDSKWAKGSFTTEEFVWPTDDTALNANLNEVIKSYKDSWSASRITTEPETHNGITYMTDVQFGGDKASTRGAASYTTEYGVTLPTTKRYITTKICKPGKLSLGLRAGSSTALATVAILTNKKGEGKKAVYLLNESGCSTTSATRYEIDITEDMLFGITEAATIYIFSSSKAALMMYYLEWTLKTDNE